jgi:hypothetical protein
MLYPDAEPEEALMATKLEKEKAFDGGQAAQAGGFPADGNPFEEGTEEHDEWARGYGEDLAEKWLNPARRISQEITN